MLNEPMMEKLIAMRLTVKKALHQNASAYITAKVKQTKRERPGGLRSAIPDTQLFLRERFFQMVKLPMQFPLY